jgi:hypothetical protein
VAAPIRDASIVTARPVVPGPIAEYAPPDALSAGSQLNRYAVGGPERSGGDFQSGSTLDVAQEGAPWPNIINGLIKFFNSWRPNNLRQIANHNVAGNYGWRTSMANFGFRGSKFPADAPAGAVAGYPGNALPGNPWVPEWNNLVPIVYGIRVTNPVSNLGNAQSSNPQSVVSQFTNPVEFTPTGTASLSIKGETLQ